MKITYVTPRYGQEIVGGAEHAARMLAERLVDQLDWDVEVFTSQALDAGTWANELRPAEQLNGVRVQRFPTTSPRHADFLNLSWKVHRSPKLASPRDQEKWVDQQGPLVPELPEALQHSDADVVVFYPYLYYPTVRGLPLVASRAVLHPAAHDEVSIRLPIYAQVFAQAQGLVFQTEGERRLAESMFPIASKPQLLLGLGVEPQEVDQTIFRTKFGLENKPYLICMGRIDEGKGSFLLAKYFAQYKQRNPGPLTLVYIGPVMQDLLKHDDIVVTGIVSEEEKWSALRGAQVLVSPSPYEAFSLALIEGWAAGAPALVNAACIATREHVMQSGGGLLFHDYLSFETCVESLVNNANRAKSLATAGKQYVDVRYRWPALIERYSHFLTQAAKRSPNPPL